MKNIEEEETNTFIKINFAFLLQDSKILSRIFWLEI